MASEARLLSEIDDALYVRMYGRNVSDLNVVDSENSIFSKSSGGRKLTFALIDGFSSKGKCVKLPKPVLTLVSNEGDDPTGCGEFSDPKKFRMWSVKVGEDVALLQHEVGKVEELLARRAQPLLDVNADFHFHDVHFDPHALRVTGRLRAYLRLHQSALGHTVLDTTVIDRDDAFTINLASLINTCIPVYSIGVADAEACFYTNPNRVCGAVRIHVDLPVVGGWSQTFNVACVAV